MLENNIFFLGARSASVGPRGVCQPPADWEKAPEAGQGASWAERSALSQPRGRRGATLAILRDTPHPRTQGPRRPARGSSAPLGGGHGTETAERTPHALVPWPCGTKAHSVEGGWVLWSSAHSLQGLWAAALGPIWEDAELLQNHPTTLSPPNLTPWPSPEPEQVGSGEGSEVLF